MGLFEGKADGRGLDLWSRGQAAEAWELLVGDCTRLHLPREDAYWVPVDGRFEIGRCLVTVYEYVQYLAQCPEVERPPDWEEQSRFPLRPVVWVSALDAEGYCQWCSAMSGRRIRLPSEEEWFLAAGNGAYEYPWGNQGPDHDRASYDYEVRHVTPVGLFPAGATGSGILDMAGNVWEWTASPWEGSGKHRVLRGGSFGDVAWDLRAAYRGRLEPGGRYSSFGFRCVREVFP